jgi:transcriptional regulator with XRE-family HTH domain
LFYTFIKKLLQAFHMAQMSFAERLSEVRKKRGFSQEELAELLGTKGPAIGRYERGVAKPTIEVAGKLAKILGVSLDYLVGNTDQELDTNTLKRILEVQKLPDDIKEKVYYFIDISVKDFKTRQAYSS